MVTISITWCAVQPSSAVRYKPVSISILQNILLHTWDCYHLLLHTWGYYVHQYTHSCSTSCLVYVISTHRQLKVSVSDLQSEIRPKTSFWKSEGKADVITTWGRIKYKENSSNSLFIAVDCHKEARKLTDQLNFAKIYIKSWTTTPQPHLIGISTPRDQGIKPNPEQQDKRR